ncbi:DUF6973 domain-containing protein [Flindersiella endophytica]
MLTYGNLFRAPVYALQRAVDDWTAMIKKIEELTGDLDDSVAKPLHESGWEGKDADAGFASIKKMSKEFEDAVKEATGIRDLLQDAHKRLQDDQNGLYRLADGVVKQEQLRPVDQMTDGYCMPEPPIEGDNMATWRGKASVEQASRDWQEANKRVSAMIRPLLIDAERASTTAAWGLGHDTGGDRGNFNDHVDNDLTTAWKHRLESYQTPDDPDPKRYKVKVGPFEEPLTGREKQIWDKLGPADKATFAKAKFDAERAATARFPGDANTGTQRDAFRHAYWSARLTRDFGPEFARQFTTAHEGNPDPNQYRVVQEEMDLHNNEVGRGIAQTYPNETNDTLADRVEQAVREGRTVGIKDKHEVWSSNQVG